MTVHLRPSSAVAVLRDAADLSGIEVLMMQRAQRGDQNSGAWVFPGGLVDAADAHAFDCCAGLSDARASETLRLPSMGLSYYVAAIRECFEEAGLLFSEVDSGFEPRANIWRARLLSGDTNVAEICRECNLSLDVDALQYISHWITPEGMPKRFDTRFFVARAPENQQATHDGNELIDSRWIRLSSALRPESDVAVVGPARWILEGLSEFTSVESALNWARTVQSVPCIQPALEKRENGSLRIVMPEAGRRGLLGNKPG